MIPPLYKLYKKTRKMVRGAFPKWNRDLKFSKWGPNGDLGQPLFSENLNCEFCTPTLTRSQTSACQGEAWEGVSAAGSPHNTNPPPASGKRAR